MKNAIPCSPTALRCSLYRPGHLLHWIHAGQVGRNPTQWRLATVVAARGYRLTVAYRDGHEVLLWHHRPLDSVAQVGQEVRLHEQYYVLDAGGSILNVVISGGLGPVSDDAVGDGYRRGFVAVADLATGNGVGSALEPQA